MPSIKLLAGTLVGIALIPGTSAAETIPVTTLGPVVSGKHGMVVSSNGDASRVGIEVLAEGGNAIDAALAVEFALNVAEPAMSGIGGGGFMVVYSADTGDVTVIDSRERAPASASPWMFLDDDGDPIPFSSRRLLGAAVGVPGALAGAEAALAMFGTWSLKDLLDPAIALAEGGVIVTEFLADDIAENASVLAADAAASAVFLPDGKPLIAGDLLFQPDLAGTLRTIGEQGVDAFYSGEIGAAFVAEVQAAGGGMTADDLAAYEVTFDEPVRGYGYFGDYELVSAAPPSSGGLTVLQALAILDRFDLTQYGHDSAAKHHVVLKAMQLAFADRKAYLGDPQFVDVPQAGWLNPNYIAERADLIDLDENTCPIVAGDIPDAPVASPSTEEDDNGHTTHFTVADRWGNLVSFTTSVEQAFGTGRMVPGYGMILNNELTDFDPIPGHPNSVHPHKRPLSSMSPTLVFEQGEPVMTIGSPGGPRIIAAVAQVLLHVLAFDLDPKTAVALPRVHGPLCSGEIRWDVGLPSSTRAELTAMDHAFEPAPLEVGNVNLITIGGGAFTGVADPRRDGVAAALTLLTVEEQ